jgi:hypothetical protein
MNGRVTGCFAHCVVQLLLVKHAHPEGDDPDKEHHEERKHQGELNQRLTV